MSTKSRQFQRGIIRTIRTRVNLSAQSPGDGEKLQPVRVTVACGNIFQYLEILHHLDYAMPTAFGRCFDSTCRSNGSVSGEYPLSKSPSQTQETPAGREHGRVTLRSVIVGSLLSLIISVGFSYARVALGKGSMSSDYITAGAICILFAAVALLNPCIKLLHRSWGFGRTELVVVYVVLAVASTIPTWGFSGLFIGTLPGVYYFATPENN